MEGMLAITFIFGGGTLFLLSISPIGRAFAARIKGNSADVTELAHKVQEVHEVVMGEMDAVRRELEEVHERLDFAERLLAKRADEPRLSPPSVSE